MITLRETKERIESDPQNWTVHLMDFVDDFRYRADPAALSAPFQTSHEKWDALLAATAAALCDELRLSLPTWVEEIPACREPWFVSGIDSLRAIALVESPLPFRLRKIFVLENFLARA